MQTSQSRNSSALLAKLRARTSLKTNSKSESNNKNNEIHKHPHHRLILALVFFAIGGLFVTGISAIRPSYAQTSTIEQDTEMQILDTQTAATQHLTSDLKRQSDLDFDVRWAPGTTVEPDTMTALFADCDPGEFAVSAMYMFENEDVQTVQSFPIAIPDDLMSWLTVVFNQGSDPAHAAVGVVCVDGDPDVNDDKIALDASTSVIIQNTVNQVIQEGGSTVNIDHITRVYQNIVQNAVQIINVTGNNNTVNAVINQSAGQIAATGGANINQTIGQNAEQIIGANVTTTTTPTEPDQEPQPGAAAPGVNATTTQETITTQQQEEETEEEGEAAAPPVTTPPEEVEPEAEVEPEPDTTEPDEEEDTPEEELENSETTDGELTDDADNTADGGA